MVTKLQNVVLENKAHSFLVDDQHFLFTNIKLNSLPNMSGPKEEGRDDEHLVNKENSTPKEARASTTATTEVRIKVGGVGFLLDQATIQLFNSEYLNKKINVTTQQAKTDAKATGKQNDTSVSDADADSFVAVFDDADAECFSAFLHMIRYDSLPCKSIFSFEKRDMLLFQAEEIWGIREQVETALDKARADFRALCDIPGTIQRCIQQAPFACSNSPNMLPQQQQYPMMEVGMFRQMPVSFPVPYPAAAGSNGSSYSSSYESSLPPGGNVLCLEGPHHNYRRDDGSRRVFCASCGHRDIDWRYHIGDYYTNCMKCNKDILYNPNLGWCHKCRMCEDCQTSDCPGVPIRQLEEQVLPYLMTTLKENEQGLTFF